MDELLRIRYYGGAADRVERRWQQSNRPFALDCVAPTVPAADLLDESDIDGVVVHGDRTVVGPVIEAWAEGAKRVPLVVFSTDDAAGQAALEAGVTHFLTVDDGFDPVDGLRTLESTMDDHHWARRDRTMIDSLLQHVPLSVYFKDRESRHVRASEAATELAEPDPSYIQNDEGKRHHTAADMLGKTDFDLYNPDHAESAIEDDRTVMETESTIKNRIEGPFGERRDRTYISTSKAPWYGEDGSVVGVVGITLDISERKQYEHRLERQNERLEQFAGVVSHDIRNPLGVALGRIDVARETGDPEHFDVIERSLERIDALIDDLLTLAREGETVDEPDTVALEPIATDAWAVVDAGDATLRVLGDVRFRADGNRLRQLFENLFRNAVEHGSTSPNSDARRDAVEHADDDVTITVGELDDGEGFFVADDGPGIPESERDDVFESGHTTNEDGTGLGLSIVRTIANAHGWSVDLVESEAGGARFEFAGVERPS